MSYGKYFDAELDFNLENLLTAYGNYLYYRDKDDNTTTTQYFRNMAKQNEAKVYKYKAKLHKLVVNLRNENSTNSR